VNRLPLLALLALPAGALAHGQGRVRAALAGDDLRAMTLRVEVEVHDLLAALPVDADRDGALRAPERAAAAAVVAAHVRDATRVTLDAAPCVPGEPSVVFSGEPAHEVEVLLTLACAADRGRLALALAYLPALAPPPVTALRGAAGDTRVEHLFGPAAPVVEVEVAGPAAPGPPWPLAVLAALVAALVVLLGVRARRRARG
jgi:hypothetical protein